jgi:hypothetical protein
MGDFLKALLVAAVAFVLFTFPSTWLLMLFFGNVAPGLGLSYVGTLPLGILASVLLGGVMSRSYVY